MGNVSKGFNNVSPSYVGGMCATFRRYQTKYSQEDVAREVGCSREIISKFERGRGTNSIIFLWYIKHGIFDWMPPNKWNGWDF